MIKSEESSTNFMHVGASPASRLMSRSPLNNNTFHGEHPIFFTK